MRIMIGLAPAPVKHTAKVMPAASLYRSHQMTPNYNWSEAKGHATLGHWLNPW